MIADARAFDPLLAALATSDRLSEKAAARALASSDTRAVEPLLEALNSRQKDSVHTGMLDALGVLGNERAFDAME